MDLMDPKKLSWTPMDPKNDALEEGCPFNYGEFGCPCWVFGGDVCCLKKVSRNCRFVTFLCQSFLCQSFGGTTEHL